MGRPKTKTKARYSFSRKPGAFDRYLANQIDSDGNKLLDTEPLKELKAPTNDLLRDSTIKRRTSNYR